MSKKIAEGHRRPGARREVRPRRVHEDRGRRAPAGRVAGVDRQRDGRADRGAAHGDGRAAGAGGRQRARSERVHRDAQGRRPRGPGRPVGRRWRRGWCCSAGLADDQADAEAQVRDAIALGRGPGEVPPDHRAAGRRPARGRRLRAAAVGAPSAPGARVA